MRLIFSLIKSFVGLLLLAAGVLTVVLLFATFFSNSLFGSNAGVVIRPGPLEGWPIWSTEARELYPALLARRQEINTPASDNPGLVNFTISPGETAVTVADNLAAQGLISDARLFVQLLHYNQLDTLLQAGSYQLRRNMSMLEVGRALYLGRTGQLSITVFAGWRLEQVAESLTANGIMDGERFRRLAAQGTAVNHPLLADRPAGMSYEGYLFPGTYHLPRDITPEEFIAVMLDNMANNLPPNVVALARQQGLTFHEVLTVASIVERETALAYERPLVASVYLNRLNPAFGETHLRADPTVQYAMGYQPAADQWWKSPVTLEEYAQVDHPYNTYIYPGLPPGPIANPSRESIMAVLQPAQTNYLFFVCRRPGCAGGEHAFATTYEEHLRNVAIYYGQE